MSASRKVRPWASLAPDMLRDVSGRLHDAADLVRIHAVCTSWRDMHSAAAWPKFLPWILTHHKGQIVHSPVIYFGQFDSTSEATASYRLNCNDVTVTSAASLADDRNWVASADGTTAWLFTEIPEPRLVHLVNGTFMPLPRFANNDIKGRMRNPHGMVCNDGTIFLYTFINTDSAMSHSYTAAILRPGDVAWTAIRTTLPEHAGQNSCAAYHDGKVLVWVGVHLWYVLTLNLEAKSRNYLGPIKIINTSRDGLEYERYVPNRCYVLESRGELLRVSVLAERAFFPCQLDKPSSAMSVLVHALEGAGREMRWVVRDGWSFADRVLFLGSKGSFAADAAELGMLGGYAYFVFWDRLCRCCLFADSEAEFVKLLPSGWGANGWLRPQPDISPPENPRKAQGSIQIRG